MNLTRQTEMILRTTLVSSFQRREVKKKLFNYVYKNRQGHPREKETEYRQQRRGGGREGNKDGIKFHLHSFTQVAPAEQGDELVFEEEAGSDWNEKRGKRCRFGGESHRVTALFCVEIIFTQKTICLSLTRTLSPSIRSPLQSVTLRSLCTLLRCHYAPLPLISSSWLQAVVSSA